MEAKFEYEAYVQKWLDLIIGNHEPSSYESLKIGTKKPPLPYVEFLEFMNHTFWLLPSVSSCDAMENLLKKLQAFFSVNLYLQNYGK